MRIETRITKCKDHKKHTVEISYSIEWRKNKRDQWRKYSTADTVSEAEQIRQICRSERGKYPVCYETRNGLRRYKVTHDYSRGQETFNVYYKLPFEKWLFHHLNTDCRTAIEQCAELARRKGPKDTVHTGLMKWPYKAIHTVQSCILCIRYPFLYPRNRWTGKHYNNWKLDELIETMFKESHECTNPVEFHKGMTDEELNQMRNPKYRITSFPKAVRCRFLKIYRWILEVIHCVPTYTEMDAMDYGWRKAFGKQLLRNVKKELKKAGMLRSYRITQIKEKWGELCWYDAGGTHDLFELLRKYEGLSYHTCISCGRTAKYRTTGYVLPLCEQCISKEDLDEGNYTEIKSEGSFWTDVDPKDFTPESFAKDLKGE